MDFFFWGFVKDSVYRSPAVRSLDELTGRIEHALQKFLLKCALEQVFPLKTVVISASMPMVAILKFCE